MSVDDRLRVRLASTSADWDAIQALAEHHFGASAVSASVVASWRARNPEISWLAEDRVHGVRGYLEILPMDGRVAEALARGTLAEEDLEARHLLPPRTWATGAALYASGVAVWDPQRQLDRRASWLLVTEARRHVLQLARQHRQVRVWAWAATPVGRLLMQRLELVPPVGDDPRAPWGTVVVRGSAL
jgi:hypothetical protein